MRWRDSDATALVLNQTLRAARLRPKPKVVWASLAGGGEAFAAALWHFPDLLLPVGKEPLVDEILISLPEVSGLSAGTAEVRAPESVGYMLTHLPRVVRSRQQQGRLDRRFRPLELVVAPAEAARGLALGMRELGQGSITSSHLGRSALAWVVVSSISLFLSLTTRFPR